MDKTEMYNKIINAIDVLDRVKGEAVIRKNITFNWEDVETFKYSIGNISILKKGKSVGIHVNGLNITDKVDKVDVIYRTLLRTYEKQQKKLREDIYESVESYLNGFVGK